MAFLLRAGVRVASSALSQVARRGGASAAAPASSTSISTLPSGLRVASERDDVETATVAVFVDVGSRYETAENNGTAHFLEHMAFKGTQKRTQRDIELEVENMGAQLNAYTSREQTVYYAKVFKHDVGKAVELLSDIVQNSVFPEVLLERERSVILREHEEVENTYQEAVLDRLHETAFHGTPLGYTILGSTDNIRSIKRDHLVDFVKTHYTAPRVVVSAAGAVDHQRLCDLVGTHFGGLSSAASGAAPVPKVPGRYTGSDLLVQNDDMPLTHIAVAMQSVGISHPDAFVFMVLQNLVGSWDRHAGGAQHLSSKLATEVANYELAHSFMSFNTMYSDTGLFGCYAVTENEHDNLDNLVYAIENEWVRLCFDATAHEVMRAKNQLKANLILSLDGTTAVAEDIGRQLLAYNKRFSPDELAAVIDAVTVNDVRRVASTYFYDQDPVMAMVGKCQGAPDYNRIRKYTHWYRT